jgi:hypothetical protein
MWQAHAELLICNVSLAIKFLHDPFLWLHGLMMGKWRLPVAMWLLMIG